MALALYYLRPLPRTHDLTPFGGPKNLVNILLRVRIFGSAALESNLGASTSFDKMSRARSRSPHSQRERGGMHAEESNDDWDENSQTMFDLFKRHDIDEDDEVIGATVQLLNESGVKKQTQLENCPLEVLNHYLPPATHGRNLILVHCLLSKLEEERKKEDPTAQAMRLMAKEQRAQRKKRSGGLASSSEDEDDKMAFDCTASLKKYGLERINANHMMRNKEIKAMAKKAMAKAQDHEPFVAGEDVLKFAPQWLSKTAPKYLDKAGMSHAVWVASWWSRSLTQIASQGHSEVSTMAFQDLLNEFLNINQIAVEKSESLAWNYDKHVWNEIQQKVERKDKTLDIKDTLGAVVQNDLDVVSQTLQSGGKRNENLRSLPPARRTIERRMEPVKRFWKSSRWPQQPVARFPSIQWRRQVQRLKERQTWER